MRTSPSEAAAARGTGTRLALLLLVGVLLLLAPRVDVTGALLTGTTTVSTVVSTQEEFPGQVQDPPAPQDEPGAPTG